MCRGKWSLSLLASLKEVRGEKKNRGIRTPFASLSQAHLSEAAKEQTLNSFQNRHIDLIVDTLKIITFIYKKCAHFTHI